MAFEEVVPTVAHTKIGVSPACRSASTCLGKRLRLHGELFVHFDQPKVRRPNSRNHRGFLQRRMRLRRRVRHQFSIAAFLVAAVFRRSLACSEQRAQNRARCRVLNDSASRTCRKKFLRQTEHTHQPIHDMRLKFSACWARRPKHPLHTQSGRQQIAENSRTRGITRKVCKEIGRLPVGHAGQDQSIDISQHRLRIPHLWRAVRVGAMLEFVPASLAKAPGATRCAIDNPQSNPPRRAHADEIPPASYGAIFLQPSHCLDSFQFPKIDSRLVIECHTSILGLLVKDAPQLLQHRFMLRMFRSRRIRGREQTPFQSFAIELLPHREHALLVWRPDRRTHSLRQSSSRAAPLHSPSQMSAVIFHSPAETA